MGTGLPRVFLLTAALLSELETISPGFAVPEASTTSLVLPADGGLKGAGPDDDAAFSQGFGGAATQSYKIVGNSIERGMRIEKTHFMITHHSGNHKLKLHFENAQNISLDKIIKPSKTTLFITG